MAPRFFVGMQRTVRRIWEDKVEGLDADAPAVIIPNEDTPNGFHRQ